jgi:hypothetical protein
MAQFNCIETIFVSSEGVIWWGVRADRFTKVCPQRV